MTELNNLIVIQVSEAVSLNGGREKNMLICITLEMSCSYKTKGKRTIRKRSTLVAKAISYESRVNHSETNIHI